MNIGKGDDAAAEILPNTELQSSYEPNNSMFSSSMAKGSVADAAAQHPSIHELVEQQRKRKQQQEAKILAHTGKHGTLLHYVKGLRKYNKIQFLRITKLFFLLS